MRAETRGSPRKARERPAAPGQRPPSTAPAAWSAGRGSAFRAPAAALAARAGDDSGLGAQAPRAPPAARRPGSGPRGGRRRQLSGPGAAVHASGARHPRRARSPEPAGTRPKLGAPRSCARARAPRPRAPRTPAAAEATAAAARAACRGGSSRPPGARQVTARPARGERAPAGWAGGGRSARAAAAPGCRPRPHLDARGAGKLRRVRAEPRARRPGHGPPREGVRRGAVPSGRARQSPGKAGRLNLTLENKVTSQRLEKAARGFLWKTAVFNVQARGLFFFIFPPSLPVSLFLLPLKTPFDQASTRQR